MSPAPGRLYGLGVGPGDPELVTLKTVRRLRESQVVAYFAARGKAGNAFTTIEGHLDASHTRLPLVYPITTEAPSGPQRYDDIMREFYDGAAAQVAAHLDAGHDVAVICEGDPMLYGSYMYLHDRLAARYTTEVVPGVCAMLGGAAMLGAPLVYRDQSLLVLSGTLSKDELSQRIQGADAVVVMKLGRNLPKVREVIAELGLLERALYIERATMPGQRIVPLEDVEPGSSPYFSLVLMPGPKWQG
ncbi:precorrin-2 C(20)-methyltransferase [Lysobacter korlensis]|uniref:Precorrin-2 C(20)-methyltransferase n=1 Tax=Lysobacter korlensis TaxID=553636 RepID=A0ABV6RS20_9GAMM